MEKNMRPIQWIGKGKEMVVLGGNSYIRLTEG